jgi:N-methylhydantoinase B
MMGGYPGAVNRYRFTRDSDILERMKRSALVTDISQVSGSEETLGLRQQDFVQNPADVYAVLWSAAGGFGDPLERDPARVEADVANGDVTQKTALEVYGVLLGDEDATRRRRHEMRTRRVQGHGANGLQKLSGKPKLRLTEGVALYDNLHYGCAKCGTDLGPSSQNYKSRCVRNDMPIQAANPIVGDPARFIDPKPQFRQFCCPGCGLLIENEIAVDGDPILKDVEILSP